MMIKHRIKCFDSEILVCAKEDASYELTIQALSNPLGFGKTLHAFPTEELAVEAADSFCRMYAAARERGYYLKEGYFAKPDRVSIDIKPFLGVKEGYDRFFAELGV